MIVVAVCSYREGVLLRSAVRSALALARSTANAQVLVLEGPVGVGNIEAEEERGPDPVTERVLAEVATMIGHPNLVRDAWETDAGKRTAALELAQERHALILKAALAAGVLVEEPLWLVWLDGDEVLLWGEYLPDLIARAEAETAAGGFPLRIVELDGSVAKAPCRVIRADQVRRFTLGAYELELAGSGMVVALPNVPICAAGGVPRPQYEGQWVGLEDLAELRPPVSGEPHILHRAVLRDPGRGVRRLHEVEAEDFERLAAEGRSQAIDVTDPRD